MLIAAVFFAVYFSSLALFAMNKDCWHDECHFVETIHLFSVQPTIQTLTHYNEMSTPLSFIVYAVWGRAVGGSLNGLRVLSMLLALATCLLFHYACFLLFQNSRYSLAATMFLAINPYMAGAGIFVFTDMSMMLCVVVFLLGMVKKNGWLTFAAGAAGLLCRQYLVFIIIAGVVYFCLEFINKKDRKTVPLLMSLLLSMVPLGLLFLLWGGISPHNELQKMYLRYKLNYDIHSVTLYIILSFVYLLPFVLFSWRTIYTRKTVIAALIVVWTYLVFPVRASPCALAVAVDTVGYFHIGLRRVAGRNHEQAVFFFLFLAALPIIITIVKNLFSRLRNREVSLSLFLEFSVIAFFIVMPFSYLHWEKYFLPMIPLLSMYLIITARPCPAIGHNNVAAPDSP